MDQNILTNAMGLGKAGAHHGRGKQAGGKDADVSDAFGKLVSAMGKHHGDPKNEDAHSDAALKTAHSDPSENSARLTSSAVHKAAGDAQDPTEGSASEAKADRTRPARTFQDIQPDAAPSDALAGSEPKSEGLLKALQTLIDPVRQAKADDAEPKTSHTADRRAADKKLAASNDATVQAPQAEMPDAQSAELQPEPGALGELFKLLANKPAGAANEPAGERKGRDISARDDAATADVQSPGLLIAGQQSAMIHDARLGQKPADDENTRSISIVRADGKGGRLDVVMPSDDSDIDAGANAASNTAAKMDSVVVLESRRYLGLATESNGLTLARAINDDLASPITSSAILPSDSLPGNVTTTVHTLKLQMHPNDLGAMTATLRLKGDELTVSVMVETADAYRQLTLDQNDLVKALQDQGFNVEHVNIQMAPTMASDGQNQPGQNGSQNSGQNSGQQQANGQAGREFGEAARDGRSGGDGRRDQSSNQGRWQANEAGPDVSPANRTGAPASGQVYI